MGGRGCTMQLQLCQEHCRCLVLGCCCLSRYSTSHGVDQTLCQGAFTWVHPKSCPRLEFTGTTRGKLCANISVQPQRECLRDIPLGIRLTLHLHRTLQKRLLMTSAKFCGNQSRSSVTALISSRGTRLEATEVCMHSRGTLTSNQCGPRWLTDLYVVHLPFIENDCRGSYRLFKTLLLWINCGSLWKSLFQILSLFLHTARWHNSSGEHTLLSLML